MNRISFRFSPVAILLSVFTLTACLDIDEELSLDEKDAFLTPEEEILSIRNGAYASLYGWATHGGIFSLQEVSSDEVIIPQRGSDWYDGGQWLSIHRHEFRPQDEAIRNGWNFLYSGIGTCNESLSRLDVLERNGKIPAQMTESVRAELSILRALFYYWLLDAYGNVPIMTEVKKADVYQSERREVFRFVEQELKDHAGKLPKTMDKDNYGRLNYFAAQALLAKLYLNAEVYTGQARWPECVAACDVIINSGFFKLEDDYFLNFNTENEQSRENIFVIPYDENSAKGFNLSALTLHQRSRETFNLTFDPWNGYAVPQAFYNSYTAHDKRKGVWGDQKIRGNFLAGPQFEANGTAPLSIKNTAVFPSEVQLVFIPEISTLSPDCPSEAGVRIGKFEFKKGSGFNMSNDFPVFRYADILLMKAEALWCLSQGNVTALQLVNEVRERAGIEPLEVITPDDLLAERGRELFFEGWRRQDLIRSGKYDEPWAFKSVSEPCKKVFLIPNDQILSNPALQQNPCY